MRKLIYLKKTRIGTYRVTSISNNPCTTSINVEYKGNNGFKMETGWSKVLNSSLNLIYGRIDEMIENAM